MHCLWCECIGLSNLIKRYRSLYWKTLDKEREGDLSSLQLISLLSAITTTMMDELPSLSFPSPMGGSRSRPSSWGRGIGRGRGRYTALEVNDMDDVPLMNEEGGVPSDDEEDEGEGEERGSGKGAWHHLGGRRNWQQQMRSHSTLLGLLFGGGWQIALKK